MIIYVRGFEKKYKDTIACIYELNTKENRDGGIETVKSPVHVNYYKQVYYLDPFKDYLVICGLSEYRIKGNDIERTFLSEKHPLFDKS